MDSVLAAEVGSVEQQVYADLLSQAITGELVGMKNYASLVALIPDIEGQMAAVHHASAELRHAENFNRVAKECGLQPIVNPDALHWRHIRGAFLGYANEGDLVACLIIQEIMLESVAVALYSVLGDIPDQRIARVFAATAKEEAAHVNDGLDHLARVSRRDPEGFADKVEQIHTDVMTVIAEMLAGEEGDHQHCELCKGSCVKPSLSYVGLDLSKMRGLTVRHYLEALDELGIPGERSLAWVARLPM